jgi:hypothetical protein
LFLVNLLPLATTDPPFCKAENVGVDSPFADASENFVALGSLMLTCLGEEFKSVLVGVATLPLN